MICWLRVIALAVAATLKKLVEIMIMKVIVSADYAELESVGVV